MAKINKYTKIILIIILLIIIAYTGIKLVEYNKTTNRNAGESNLLEDKAITAAMVINTGNEEHKFESNISSGTNAFDFLKKVNQEQKLDLIYKNTNMGAFIEGIYGIKNDAVNSKFWMYKINGKFADVGASNYVVRNGDSIEWVYSDGSELSK